jgi:ribonuclease-3
VTRGGVSDPGALCERIGYRFSDHTYLERALTHSSFADGDARKSFDNERLEFLGDRVLGVVVAELLFNEFPTSSEGQLAPRFNALVRKEACADVARELDLGTYMRMSAGEDQAGGRGKDAILGDCCEALIAAIYLDGGFDAARRFVRRFWTPRLSLVEHPPRDAKTIVQEWLQGRGLRPPRYVLVERTGPDHAPEFTIAIEIEGLAPVQAKAGSKRAAEQLAAEILLLREGIVQS